jgi:hypothetical protein
LDERCTVCIEREWSSNVHVPDSVERLPSRNGHSRFLRALAGCDILAMCVTLLGSVWGLFIGPGHRWLTGGSLLVTILLMGTCMHNGFRRVMEAHPNGLSTSVGWLRGWKKRLRWTWIAIFVLVFASGLSLVATNRRDQVIQCYPIFARRDVYLLNRYDNTSAVSRARYVAVGVSIEVAYACLLLCVQLCLLHVLWYNEPPVGPKMGGIWSKGKRNRGRSGLGNRDKGSERQHSPEE